MNIVNVNGRWFQRFLLTVVLVSLTLAGVAYSDKTILRSSLTILHTNDTHGRWEPFSESIEPPEGGIARRAAAIKKLKAQSSNVLLVDAGDIAQGTLFNKYYRGSEARDLYNVLGYDAVALGNHEFDMGVKTLADKFLTGAKFDVVMANVDLASAPELVGKVKPYVIRKVGNLQVGIIGIITDEFANLSPLGKDITILPIIPTVQKAITELTAKGINKIILLSHQGYKKDIELAKAVPGIDVIVGGNSETLLGEKLDFPRYMPAPAGSYPTVVSGSQGPTLVVQAYNWGRILGQLHVSFDRSGVITEWSGRGIHLTASLPEDPAIKKMVRQLKEPLIRFGDTVIGQARVHIDGYRRSVRNQETPLGNLIADALLYTARHSKPEIAIQQGGGIRDSMMRGEITYEDVYTSFPFDNYVVEVVVPGVVIRQALEHGLSQIDLADPAESGGAFPQVAGLRMKANLRKPVGQRIESIEVKTDKGGYAPLDPARMYRVVSNSFLLGGGDGYVMFGDYLDRKNYDQTVADALIEFVRAHSPVTAAIEGRIQLTR